MRRLVLAATIMMWSGLALAQAAPAEADDMVNMLASTIDEQRPLGSPPLLVVYILVAALGVRIAIRKKAKEA